VEGVKVALSTVAMNGVKPIFLVYQVRLGEDLSTMHSSITATLGSVKKCLPQTGRELVFHTSRRVYSTSPRTSTSRVSTENTWEEWELGYLHQYPAAASAQEWSRLCSVLQYFMAPCHCIPGARARGRAILTSHCPPPKGFTPFEASKQGERRVSSQSHSITHELPSTSHNSVGADRRRKEVL